MRPSTVTVAALLVAAPIASGTTYTVNPEGTGDFPTIQAAVDATDHGDVIELTDGTFTGDGNRDIDFLGKQLTLRSQSGDPDLCVIDCEGSETEPHRGLSLVSGEPAGTTVAGLTIRNGWSVWPEHGGAVFCDNGAAPGFQACTFSANRHGAVACWHDCSVEFTGCLFTGNVGEWGGGVRVHGCTLTFSECSFIENEAGEAGGAIQAFYSQVEIDRCGFARNVAEDGGGIHFGEGGPLTVRDCLFEENTAAHLGGAVWLFLAPSNTFERCTFAGNSGATAGAMFSEKISRTFVNNCTFWGNRSQYCTILAGHEVVSLANTIIAFSIQGAAVISHYDWAELSCCDIFGNEGGDWVGNIADQYGINGNICEDPLFCDPENGDFSLDAGSPCAPFSPPNPECDLTGAWPVGCGGTPALPFSWGAVKALFRE